MRPTFKLILFSRANAGGLHTVMLRVTFARQSRYFNLHRYCTPDQWDESAGRLRKTFKGHAIENDMLRTYEQRASDALRYFEREMIRFSFDAFEKMVFADRIGSSSPAWRWVKRIADGMREEGRAGNASFYDDCASAMKAFAPHSALVDIDFNWLTRFERWMSRKRQRSGGGMSVIFRTLRASINRAARAGEVPKDFNPFADYSFAHLKNQKSQRAIPLEQFYAIRDAECFDRHERLSLDLFLFSFYCRGMNFADIIELRASNIQNLRIFYIRKKTGKTYSVPIIPEVGAILDRYKGGYYLFPVLDPAKHGDNEKKLNRRKRAIEDINARLRTLAARVGVPPEGISFYMARHVYANAHKQAGTPLEVIRELMGHADFKTSEHYLRGFGVDSLDQADRALF